MRCPICDYDNELSPDHQSSFFSGLSFDIKPNPYLDEDGNTKCNCFDSEFDEEESFDDEEA